MPAGGRLGAVSHCRAVCMAAAVAGLFATAFAGGCTQDLTDSGGSKPNPDSGNDYVTLQLVVPGTAAAQTYAAAVSQETLIEAGKLHVLLYGKNNEDNWQFVTVASPGAEDITKVEENADGYATYDIRIPVPAGNLDRTFRAGLVTGLTLDEVKEQGGYTQTEEEGEQWVVFAGCTVDSNGERVANPLSEARTKLTFATAGKWPVPPVAETFRNFPMWGESGTFILRPAATITGKIRMVRAVARVDVGVNFKKDGDGHFPLNDMQAQGLYDEGRGTYFALETVSVFRTAKDGICGAREQNIDMETGQVTAISLSDRYDTFKDKEPLRYTFAENELTVPAPAPPDVENRRCLTRQCYIPETKNAGLEFDQATCIVVGGKYGSASAATTYYRIDFAEVRKDAGGGQLRPTPDSRFDLLRNHAYVVNITSVAGHGESTEEEALYGENTKLTAEVVDWDQSQQVGDIVTDGVYMLNLSKREQKFYCDGTPELLAVTTNYDGELGKGWKLKLEGSDAFKKSIRYYDANGVAHEPGSVGWPSQGATGTTELRFGMEELDNNADGSERTLSGRLVFEAGRMKSQVTVSQTSRDLLRILFNPEELYFGPEGPEKRVGITVTTRKPYTLTLAGTDAGGKTYQYQLHPTSSGANPDDRFKTFFAKDRDVADEYLVEPTRLPDDNPRTFTFDVTATLSGSAAGVNPVTERFTIYQLKDPVEWKVVTNTARPYELRQNKGYEVIVGHDATNVYPKVETTPSALAWWFPRGEAGTDYSWITNLETWFGKKIENVATTYRDGLEFQLRPNPGLGRRSITLQVESNTPGLSPREANLKITQKGTPLKLEPSIAEQSADPGKTIVKQSDPEGGKPGIYLLDHGYGAGGGSYKLNMTSNTNWYWYWNMDRGEDVHQANMDLVAQGWTATPADRVQTTDHPDNGKGDHTWENVASFTVPDFDRGSTAFDEAKKDQAQPDVPLGGERIVVRELRNVHPELTADDMRESARQLHIRRELPAHTHILEWPFENMTSLNWAMENNKYDGARFRFGTNATGKLTLTTGFDVSEQSQLNREKQYTSAQGYKLYETTFAELPKVAITPESENDDPVFYKLRFTGRTSNAEETANDPVDESKVYYTGTQMHVPLRNMQAGQYYLSSGAHTLKLDFSNSYFNRIKVRVKAVLVNTEVTQDGVDDYLAKLSNSDPAFAKEKHLFPASDWEKGKEILSDGSSKMIEVPLAENNHKNMMYKIVVEYARHRGGGVYDEKNWLEVTGLKVYQDGKPCDGSSVIWKYSAGSWRNGTKSYSGGNPPNQSLLPANTDPGNLVAGSGLYWQEASPLVSGVQGMLPGFVGSFNNAKSMAAIASSVTVPVGTWRQSININITGNVCYAFLIGHPISSSGSAGIYWSSTTPYLDKRNYGVQKNFGDNNLSYVFRGTNQWANNGYFDSDKGTANAICADWRVEMEALGTVATGWLKQTGGYITWKPNWSHQKLILTNAYTPKRISGYQTQSAITAKDKGTKFAFIRDGMGADQRWINARELTMTGVAVTFSVSGYDGQNSMWRNSVTSTTLGEGEELQEQK